jgi:hypothetical protein
MPALKTLLWPVALAFAAFSTWVLWQLGYFGIWQGGFANLGSTQITFDLIIACTLLVGYIARDCRARGQAWWPWALLTLVAGSLGPLAYLLWPRRQP